MDFGDIADNAPLIVGAIVLILMQFFLRKRRPGSTSEGIVQNLLSAVKINQVLVETFSLRQKPKKFETISWHMNKNKIDFLDESLQSTLSYAFDMTDDFNRQLGAAKKYKSASFTSNIDANKLQEPLSKSKKGLEEWLLVNTGTKDTTPNYPSKFGGLFGRR